jgi:DNA-binding NtrC family response regulator
MAAALAEQRASQEQPVVKVSAFDGLPKGFRPGASVVVNHVDALDRRQQAELAAIVREGQVLMVATAREETSLGPELAALLDATKITLPPLHARADDVAAWAEFFVERAAHDAGLPVPKLSASARQALSGRRWPGNLSELEAVVRRAVFLGEGPTIEPNHLGFGEAFVVQSLTDAVEAFRMEYMAKVLNHFDGNRTQAARALGVDPRTMFRYLAKARGSEGE